MGEDIKIRSGFVRAMLYLLLFDAIEQLHSPVPSSGRNLAIRNYRNIEKEPIIFPNVIPNREEISYRTLFHYFSEA